MVSHYTFNRRTMHLFWSKKNVFTQRHRTHYFFFFWWCWSTHQLTLLLFIHIHPLIGWSWPVWHNRIMRVKIKSNEFVEHSSNIDMYAKRMEQSCSLIFTIFLFLCVFEPFKLVERIFGHWIEFDNRTLRFDGKIFYRRFWSLFLQLIPFSAVDSRFTLFF